MSDPAAAAVTRPGAFHDEAEPPFWRIYAGIAAPELARRAVGKADPRLGVTEHAVSPDERVAVLVNHSPRGDAFTLTPTGSWHLDAALWGAAVEQADGRVVVDVPANDLAVLRLRDRP